MGSTRIFKGVICLAASMLLCGALVLAQDQTGNPGSSSGTNSTTGGASSGSGSMSGSSAGSMQGSSANGMKDNSNMSGGSGKVTADDKHFMKEAMEGDMAEIQLAQLAQQKASSDQVKQFAQRMIDDHTKLDAQMKPLAQQFGVDAPSDLSAKHKTVQNKLQGLSGAKFDQEYVKAMVSDHREDDQAFLRESTLTTDPTLKNAVSQAEPIIAEHLRMAQDLEKSLKGSQGSM
jgi:putative membrane protein